LGTNREVKHAKRAHARGEFIKVCVGVAENGAPLIALEEALQIKAGVRRTREDPMHRDWLNVVAHGGGAGKGATLWTKEQQKRISSLGGRINGRRTSRLYRTDTDAAARMDAADMQMWRNEYPHLPTVLSYEAKKSKGAAPKGDWHIVAVSRPEAMNPECPRGLRLRRAYRCDTARQFGEAYAADQQLHVGGGSPGKCLGFMARVGVIALVCPDTGRVVLGPGMEDERLRHQGGRWMRGRVRSLGPYGWSNPPPAALEGSPAPLGAPAGAVAPAAPPNRVPGASK
jgi:hypothetical protein